MDGVAADATASDIDSGTLTNPTVRPANVFAEMSFVSVSTVSAVDGDTKLSSVLS